MTLLIVSCKSTRLPYDAEVPFAIVIHGGAGDITPENTPPEKQEAIKKVLYEAVQAGHQILKKGGTSLEAVQASIVILENSPYFNAGKGSVFTHEGKNELDASIMDGKTLNAGAVAGVTTIKNPIRLAYEVMVHSPHVMLSREGAEYFAIEQGVEIVPPSYFHTDERKESLTKVQNSEKYGTVGCVALDRYGNLAAGTSTGGMTNKKWGRIGDSPIIGAGTYADNNSCAVSCTGWGEYFIRAAAAFNVSALMQYKNVSLTAACNETIEKINTMGGNGGIIAIDKKGTISQTFNTKGMYRASIDTAGNVHVAIF
ncbi:MAG: isoaspartyl peptidase/L-asparaginase [Capnocytophaga sp.]|nr:isoaspartyl peptidase/L-asparaginase [Capnocytophaga sp.]